MSSEPDQAGPLALWFRRAIGAVLLGPYLRLVRATSTVLYEPANFWESVAANWPVIVTSWHGQSNLGYAIFPEPQRFAIMVSTHPDGQLAAGLARSFGFSVVAGSGASTRQRHRTGGVAAFRQMLKQLAQGSSVIATADVPPVPGRTVSPGIVAMARHSGRPVFVIAIANSRRRTIDNWDAMQFNYPFSRIAFVGEGPFYMTDSATSDGTYLAELRASLDRALGRALALADGGR